MILFGDDRAARNAPAGKGFDWAGLRLGPDRLFRLSPRRGRPRAARVGAGDAAIACGQDDPGRRRSGARRAGAPRLAYAGGPCRSRRARLASTLDLGSGRAGRDRDHAAAGAALTGAALIRARFRRPLGAAEPCFTGNRLAVREVANRAVSPHASEAARRKGQMATKRRPEAVKLAEPDVSVEALKRYYADMVLIRRFEERAGQMYGMGLIGGFCHLYIGQEAVVVGMQAALEEGDTIITSYRDHGHMLACGMDPKGVMAELTGRSGGYSHGKGGSMHMFSKEKGFFGGHGIGGAQVSLGTGRGFSNWYRENDRVSLTYFGEGASNQGQVYESFNLAALMKLPVIFIIENNRYGM